MSPSSTNYYTEPGSVWVRSIVDNPDNACIVCEISIPETAAALSQLQQHKRIGKSFVRSTFERFRSDLRRGLFFNQLLNTAILNRAAELALRFSIKGYDAVHVAAALLAQDSVGLNTTFVSGDRQALRTAGGTGLLIENPFDHVDNEIIE